MGNSVKTMCLAARELRDGQVKLDKSMRAERIMKRINLENEKIYKPLRIEAEQSVLAATKSLFKNTVFLSALISGIASVEEKFVGQYHDPIGDIILTPIESMCKKEDIDVFEPISEGQIQFKRPALKGLFIESLVKKTVLEWASIKAGTYHSWEKCQRLARKNQWDKERLDAKLCTLLALNQLKKLLTMDHHKEAHLRGEGCQFEEPPRNSPGKSDAKNFLHKNRYNDALNNPEAFKARIHDLEIVKQEQESPDYDRIYRNVLDDEFGSKPKQRRRRYTPHFPNLKVTSEPNTPTFGEPTESICCSGCLECYKYPDGSIYDNERRGKKELKLKDNRYQYAELGPNDKEKPLQSGTESTRSSTSNGSDLGFGLPSRSTDSDPDSDLVPRTTRRGNATMTDAHLPPLTEEMPQGNPYENVYSAAMLNNDYGYAPDSNYRDPYTQ